MKILHILPSYGYGGGVASLVYDLCEVHRQMGHDISLLMTANHVKLNVNGDRFEKIGVKLMHSCCHPYSPLQIMKMRQAMIGTDVTHVHLFPNQLYAAIAWLTIPKKKRPKLITTEHNTYNNRRKHHIFKFLDLWMYSRYDKVICISNKTEYNLNIWLKSSKLQQRILTIINGININKFKNASNKLPQLLTLNPNNRYIVMVGRLTHPKDPLTIVRALALCKRNVHLIFIGRGELADDIKNESAHLEISNRVHLLGRQENVAELIKGCDIGVLSTQWDGFGLVAAEYMAAGIPVLASDVDGLRDVVGRPDLLFPVKNHIRLAELITKLLDDSDRYRSMQLYCINKVEEFSHTNMGFKYMRIYQNNKISDLHI